MDNPDTAINAFMIAFALSGLLVVGLSIPMILRKVKPNHWYGFRTGKTLSDEKVWYEANAYAGRLLFVLGLVWAAAAALLRMLRAVGDNLDAYALTFSAVMMISLLAVVVASLLYVRKL